jgi:hypothetical protein
VLDGLFIPYVSTVVYEYVSYVFLSCVCVCVCVCVSDNTMNQSPKCFSETSFIMLTSAWNSYLTFRGAAIVIYSYNKSQLDAMFLKFILITYSKCFRHIYGPSSEVSTLYTQCWDSWWWTVDLSKTCRVLYQNKFEK